MIKYRDLRFQYIKIRSKFNNLTRCHIRTCFSVSVMPIYKNKTSVRRCKSKSNARFSLPYIYRTSFSIYQLLPEPPQLGHFSWLWLIRTCLLHIEHHLVPPVKSGASSLAIQPVPPQNEQVFLPLLVFVLLLS